MPAATYNRSLRIFWQAHRWIYRTSNGRFGAKINGIPVLLLTTTGRKSGEARSNTLYFFEYEDDFILVASNAGRASQPSWYLNLLANPDATVLVFRHTISVTASTASGELREHLWEIAIQMDPSYIEYQQRTEREIPVVVLSPKGSAD